MISRLLVFLVMLDMTSVYPASTRSATVHPDSVRPGLVHPPAHPLSNMLAQGKSLAGNAIAQAALLPELALMQFQGPDAVTFLQGQTTNDMMTATSSQARLAGYCTAQGRLLASAVFWQTSTGPDGLTNVLALLQKDILATTQQRLSMFVLRAKVKIQPLETVAPVGVSVPSDYLPDLEKRLGHGLPAQAWQVVQALTGTWIAAPRENASTLRFWWIAGQDNANAVSALAGAFEASNPDEWQAADVRAGLPWITAATRDLFIPQTLNLDLIEGVSFTKGCYPGQEVVARSHYRGTLKRRMALGWTSAQEVPLASDIVGASDPEHPCGRVVNRSWDGTRQWILFECTFDALASDELQLAGAAGDLIHLLPLPYPVPRPGQTL